MKLLAGITILDFSRVLAAPMATQILAELGATVTKIERPELGDETRGFEPRLPHGESAYFLAFNRGKRSVTLNLKSAAGCRIARRMADHVDVVVENFLPGTMDTMGLGYDELQESNPGLIYVSATGFGQDGPDRDRKGYDTVFQALSGIMSLTGQPDGPPAKVGVPISDLTTGLWVVIAVLAGLAGRATRGHGAYLDVAMMDVQTSLLALAAARVFALNEEPFRDGTQHPGRVPSAAFRCADGGWLQISASDQHWPALCEVLDLEELGGDESLADNAGRVEARDLVMWTLEQAIAKRDRQTLVDELRRAGIPVGEVRTVREVLDDPHTRFREMVGHFDHPTAGEFPALRTPLRIDGFDDPVPASPPALGADTDDILRSELGMSAVEIEALRNDGVI